MIQRTTLFLLCLIGLISCAPKREDLIARNWQEVSMNNPQLDAVMASQQAFIDTVGKTTDTAENIRNYGVADIDSFKQDMQQNLDSFKAAQARAIASTRFDFHPEGVVYLYTEEGKDSASWYFEDDGILLLDEQKLKGVGAQLRVEVAELNDTLLHLKFMENNSSSSAIFKPVKK